MKIEGEPREIEKNAENLKEKVANLLSIGFLYNIASNFLGVFTHAIL